MAVTRDVIAAVQRATAREHGSTFRRTGTHPVGGLRGAGDVAGTELWLVVSSSGRGLFDAVSGQRVARDSSVIEGDGQRPRGIGAAADRSVPVFGIDGGALPRAAPDGWRITFDERAGLWLTPPSGELAAIEVLRVPLQEVRVIGFSSTGDSFVVGDPATFVTYARAGR